MVFSLQIAEAINYLLKYRNPEGASIHVIGEGAGRTIDFLKLQKQWPIWNLSPEYVGPGKNEVEKMNSYTVGINLAGSQKSNWFQNVPVNSVGILTSSSAADIELKKLGNYTIWLKNSFFFEGQNYILMAFTKRGQSD